MITFSNGHCFEYMTASGALGFAGKGWPWEWPLRWAGLLDPSLFTNVIKTLTLKPRKGNLKWYNPLGCIRPMRGGIVNAVGLTNPGIDWWIKNIGPKVNSSKIPLIGSILGEPSELAIMAAMLNNFDLVGLEVNASCPNTQDDILKNTEKVIRGCESAKRKSRLPILLKVSAAHDMEKIVRQTGGMVEAYSINSVPWHMVFPGRKSPLAKFGGGGVSGKIAQPFTWLLVEKLVSMTSAPVIGPSVWDFKDIAKLRAMGAKAVSFGSVFICHPWRPTRFVRIDSVQQKGANLWHTK